EPEVEVSQAQPDVSVRQSDPEVSIRQAEPEVSVRQGEPEVDVRQGETDVSVGQRSEQQAQSAESRQSEQQARVRTESSTQLDAQDIVGDNIVTADGDDIGEVSGVARSRSDSELHALIDVGGFLGIGERTVAMPMDRSEEHTSELQSRENLVC